MSCLNIKGPMHLTVKSSENNVYNHKSLWKLDFTLIQLCIICEKHSPCYIFPLPEGNKIYMSKYPFKSEDHSKAAYDPRRRTKVVKF